MSGEKAPFWAAERDEHQRHVVIEIGHVSCATLDVMRFNFTIQLKFWLKKWIKNLTYISISDAWAVS
jgi:hypothetical protein